MNYEFLGRTNILVEPATPNGSCFIVLHGGGGQPSYIQNLINLEAQFTDSYILYVSAEGGYWKHNVQGTDVAYIYALIEDLKKTRTISKLAVLGHSQGGMMAYKLAAVLDEVTIEAVIAISSVYQNPHTYDSTAKVLHVHCTGDTVVPLVGSTTYPSIVSTMNKVSSVNPTFKIIQEDLALATTKATQFGLATPQDAYHNLSYIVAAYPDLYNEIRAITGL